MMRFIVYLAVSFLLRPPCAANAQRDNDKTKSSSLLRGGSSSSAPKPKKQPTTPTLLHSSDPFADISRSGIDRSLSYIDFQSELNLPMSQEQLDALSGYISEYSVDGNDDASKMCPFDYEGDVDPFRPENNFDGRSLMEPMEHQHSHFIESSCNSNLNSTTCVNWSTYFNGTDLSSTEEVKIPCGECVTLDADPNQALFGTHLTFGHGLNIVGKLVIPNDADIEITTKYIFVQGELVMPAPPAGSSTGISSIESGNRVKINLYGTNDLFFKADNATDNAHLGEKDVSAKAFVVAGGKVDIRSMDPTCPSWVKLQSIQYGNPFPNIATNKTATQSSTFNSAVDGAEWALDGLENTYTHTECNAFQPWWEVDLEDVYTIASMKIVNRLDCCGGRLHDFDIWFLDEEKEVVDSIDNLGQMGSRKTFSTDYVNARYVKIQLRDTDCLQLGEVEIYGYPAGDPVPVESLDILTVGSDAARCWSTKGSRILLTSDTYEWNDSQYAIVAYVPNNGADGKLHMLPLPKKKTAADETFGFPDFAVEVALLDRSLVIQGEKEDSDSEFANLGGHFIVLHTPHVHQHLEGALFQNMGQQGRLGRYPLHFHMSESVHGSTLAKNVIWKSFQRCIVIHGTHNVTVRDNVAFDTLGHCFMLEDGGEWDNQFLYNLGAKTGKLPPNTPVPGETDNFPSTFWITNPSSHWIGNVAAGSEGPGIWFELKLRGPSANLEINQGINPKNLPLGTFDDNTAHSNKFRGGITTYETGYLAPPGTTWNNIKSFKNQGSGLFQHGTTNIYLKGGLLADNREAARNFHHEWAVYDGVRVIGRSEHVQSMIDQGRLGSNCGQAGGISIQPNEGRGHGTTIKNSIFSGFDDGCTGGKNAAIWVENDQVRNAVFDASPTIMNNTFGSLDKRISACMSINNSPDGWVRYIAIEDDGSTSAGGPGFYVQDEPAITNFIDSASCEAVPDSCLMFCLGACLRLGIVSVSQDLTTRGFKMHIQDGTLSATVERRDIWFDELQNHLSAQLPIVLPTSGKYTITFTDKNDEPAWPGYASLSLDQEPACSGGLADSSQVDFVMPEPDSRCEDLFHYVDYTAGIHGWQNFFSGIKVTQEGGSYVISTTRRKDDRGHVNLSRTLDASCIAGLGGRTYTIFGKIRMTDADGNYVETDGSSDASPKVAFSVPGLMSQSWNLATNADGSWTEFSRDITLPDDSSSAWKAQLIIDQAEKKEFHITEWGMVLTPSAAPTTSPSGSPTLSPTTAEPSVSPSKSPTNSPTTSPRNLPTSSPTTAAPITASPTDNPVTAAPAPAVPTNLALNGFASADSECYGGYAYNAIDGNADSINHSCCTNYGAWLMVDLGKDTVNFIDNIVIRNRINCCGGRLKRFFVEVLDTEKNVVFSQYHEGGVSNGVVKTFTVNDGTAGRYVRVRHEDSYKDCLHVGEVEVWGYPIERPAVQPEIIEMALNRPSTASSNYGSSSPSKSNDGDVNTIHHSKCDAGNPWWQVDLGVDSFVQDVIITNRKDCCGGRLRSTTVEILDSDQNVVDTRLISGSVGNGHVVQKVFNEDTSIGRYVKVFMQRQDCLHMAEVAVNGYHVEQVP